MARITLDRLLLVAGSGGPQTATAAPLDLTLVLGTVTVVAAGVGTTTPLGLTLVLGTLTATAGTTNSSGLMMEM